MYKLQTEDNNNNKGNRKARVKFFFIQYYIAGEKQRI